MFSFENFSNERNIKFLKDLSTSHSLITELDQNMISDAESIAISSGVKIDL
jgi:hypothetical protein